jgi:hypothetical protein
MTQESEKREGVAIKLERGAVSLPIAVFAWLASELLHLCDKSARLRCGMWKLTSERAGI